MLGQAEWVYLDSIDLYLLEKGGTVCAAQSTTTSSTLSMLRAVFQ